ncbi:GAF domain-containing SpoIIE family protein phosphatase [Gracilimonas sp. Q87]|uniref:GAF domain-containing SpoIIE family protein phosphatase n=1 Tax=Gracilimonas sp. Q87 TaxID=3384766 RepID=UPI0039844C5B
MDDFQKLIEENKQLKLAVNELSILNNIASSISSTQSVETIIDTIVIKCVKHLNAEEGTVSLLEKGSEDIKFHTMIRRQDLTQQRVPIHLDHQITGWMLRKQVPLLSNDLGADNRFTLPPETGASIQSMLCVPLIAKGDLIGYLAVFNKKNEALFEEKDRRLLVIIASQSAQIIENSRLYEEEKEYLMLKEEMKVATQIQNNLLPDKNPDIPVYEIVGFNVPAKEVGGDYYDFIEIDENNVGFCIGDITGKGMPAALLMAGLQASLRSQVLIHKETNKCVENINKLLYRNTEATKFATLFYGVLDRKDHKIHYCNAGHDQPLVFRTNKLHSKLEVTGMLLGVVDEATYECKSISLEPDDIVIIFTDGITEAMNKDLVEFGLDRTVAVIENCAEESASFILQQIYEQVISHSDSYQQSDDITIMVIKRVQ